MIGAPEVYASEQLASTATAATVRVRDGETVVSDGPFAEMKEFFGSFYLLEVADRDAALLSRLGYLLRGWAGRWRCVRSLSGSDVVRLVPSRSPRSSSVCQRSPTKEGTMKYALLIYDDPAG